MSEIQENSVTEEIVVEKSPTQIFSKQKISAFNIKILSTVVVLSAFIFVVAQSHFKHKNIAAEKPIKNTVAAVVTPAENKMQNQLNDITAKLANIEASLSNKNAFVDIDSIKLTLASLITQINQISQSNDKTITSKITQSNDQLNTQLKTIKSVLVDIKKQNVHHTVISSSNLPFKLVSIDNIQENDIVTINYDSHMLPLEINDYLAGWKLIKASTVNQKAEFENKQKNYVKINLNNATGFGD